MLIIFHSINSLQNLIMKTAVLLVVSHPLPP